MRRLLVAAAAIAVAVAVMAPAVAQDTMWHRSPSHTVEVESLEFIGQATFPTGFMFGGVEVGGLSGITYDERADIYYSISDDRAELGPARFYTLTVDVSDGTLEDGDVEFLGQTSLLDESGRPYGVRSLDPEAIALAGDRIYVTSEGDVNSDPQIDPFVNQYSLGGPLLATLPVADRYLPTPDGSSGIRNNLAFEALTIQPDGKRIISATENALFQDDNASTLDTTSLSRIFVYRTWRPKVKAEYLYEVDVVPDEPDPPGAFNTNGLVELLALDNRGTMLAMERAFSVGAGNDIRIYQISLRTGDNVKRFDSITGQNPRRIEPVDKKLVIDLDVLEPLGIVLDNLEGMAFGPLLPDGRQSLILVSDNNFNAVDQKTQFLAFAVELSD